MKSSAFSSDAASARSNTGAGTSFYTKAVAMDEHLVSLAKAEYGTDHSNYARAVLTKANTLVAASTEQPVCILDELATAQ